MHCALVEPMGTQKDHSKTYIKDVRDLIDKVRNFRVCGDLSSSPPNLEHFNEIQQVWVVTQGVPIEEADLADLVGCTAAKIRSLESGAHVKRLSTDVSQR
jgi:hypothetical protein